MVAFRASVVVVLVSLAAVVAALPALMGHLVLVVVGAVITESAVRGYRDFARIKVVLAAVQAGRLSKQIHQLWAVLAAQLLAIPVVVVRLVLHPLRLQALAAMEVLEQHSGSVVVVVDQVALHLVLAAQGVLAVLLPVVAVVAVQYMDQTPVLAVLAVRVVFAFIHGD